MADESVYRLGCDIGGTFTDFIVLDEATGEVQIEKCLTTPQDPSEAVQAGVEKLGERLPDFLRSTVHVVHGTTLVINAVIERKGAKTGLIATEGFRDTLEFGRERRYDNYDLFPEFPEPLVPRHLRLGVKERTGADGRILRPVDRQSVLDVAQTFAQHGIESIAVCLLHSYANPEHELQVREIVREVLPGVSLTISGEVLPEIKEYERTSTTVVNAYTKPVTEKYMARLSDRLDSMGFQGKLFIMLSGGGITSVETAKEFPVRVIESGPVAGVVATEYLGSVCGINDLLSFDMGGTTAKICVVEKGRATRGSNLEVARTQRFKKGSGFAVQVPTVDLLEIGAGGGSIAHVSELGLLQVGPHSSGADPGPACYCRGGKQPTVTDADVVLGYLDPNYFLGGEMQLDKRRAEDAIAREVAEPLGVSLKEAAWGIHNLVNENMALASKMHVAEKGSNPKRLTLLAFGGAGPVHAYGLSRKLKVPRFVVPVAAGVASAWGFFAAPISFELVRTRKMILLESSIDEIEETFQMMEREGAATLRKADSIEAITYERSMDMRYVGQGYDINVPLRGIDLVTVGKERVLSLFLERYEQFYGRIFSDVKVEIQNFRVVAQLPGRPLTVRKVETKAQSLSEAIKGERLAFSMASDEYVPHTVYDRYRLFPSARLSGPAIIEERESTTVVGEKAIVETDDFGNLRISLQEG